MEAVAVQTARETHRQRDEQTSRAEELQAQVGGLVGGLCMWALNFPHIGGGEKKES